MSRNKRDGAYEVGGAGDGAADGGAGKAKRGFFGRKRSEAPGVESADASASGSGVDSGLGLGSRSGAGSGALSAGTVGSKAGPNVASAAEAYEILEGTFDPYAAEVEAEAALTEAALPEKVSWAAAPPIRPPGQAPVATAAGTDGAANAATTGATAASAAASSGQTRGAASAVPVTAATAVMATATMATATTATAVLTRPQPAPEVKPKAQKAMPKADRRTVIVVGGEPRADLLPPEVRAQRGRAKTAQRALLWLVVVIVAMALIIAGSVYLAMNAQTNLANEQARTQSILVQQQKYSDVLKVQGQVDLIKAGQQVGASTEIDWKTYLTQLQGTLPAGVAITTVNIDSASPLAQYAQATAPLQGSRVATLSFSATTPTLPDVQTWLDALEKLPGFADATPGTITQKPDGTYTADVTMHINKDAFDGRFATKKGN